MLTICHQVVLERHRYESIERDIVGDAAGDGVPRVSLYKLYPSCFGLGG